MFEVKFGRKDEPSSSLRRSEDLVAVRTRSSRPLAGRPVKPPAAGHVQDGHLILEFPRQAWRCTDLKRTYTPADTPALKQARGKSAAGTWGLEVRDAAARTERWCGSLWSKCSAAA
jgi:hypothetical protein